MLRWSGRNPIKIWKVPSKSERHPDTGEPIMRTISLWGNGQWDCGCPAFKKCYHIRNKIVELENQFGSMEKAICHYRLTKCQKKKSK